MKAVDSKFWVALMVPLIVGLMAWAFNTNAEFAKRENRIANVEARTESLVSAILRLEQKIDALKDLIIGQRRR